MRIAMISEHASPLATLGGEDAGGQNTHVAELSAALAAQGHDVRVYTRRDGPALPDTVELPGGVTRRARAGRPAGGDPQGRAAAAHGGVRPASSPTPGGTAAGRPRWRTPTSG